MRVANVAKELGVSRDWLRRLERLGRIPAVARDPNGHRRYTPTDVARLRALIFGPPAGTLARDTPELQRLREWCKAHGLRWTPLNATE